MIWTLLLVSCSDKSNNDDSGDTTVEPPLTCEPDSQWAPGTVAFRDATADWGLDVLMATGGRITATDFDGDGWPDLAVRVGDTANDYATGARTSWLLRNDQNGGFEDVTESTNIMVGRNVPVRPGHVFAWGDVDNDGDLDVYTGFTDNGSSGETAEVALQDGGTFTLASADSDLRVGAGDYPASASFTDVDLDGNLDLWVVEYADAAGSPLQDRLYQGDGTGAFTDVTGEWGLTTESWSSVDEINMALGHTYAWAGAACDLSNDGLPDLLSASYGRAPNHLWRSTGSGYENHSVASGYAYDDRQDWSDNWSAQCWCSLHRDDDDCADVPEPDTTWLSCNSDDDAFRWDHTWDREPFRLGGNSGTTVCADLDNDGLADLFTTEIVHWDVGSSSDPSEILRNLGDATFERMAGEVTGVTKVHEDETFWDDGDMTAAAFDFDNDGWKDLYLGTSDYPGTRGHLYHQDSPLGFTEVDIAEGIDHTRSAGVVTADFDRDGDLDVVVGHSSMRCHDDCYDTFNVRLFENEVGSLGNWFQLALEGEGANRSAIGARVEVTTPDGVTQTTQVDGGHGQWGYQDDLVQHVGLGASCEADVTVTWPDTEHSTTTVHLITGTRYRLVQGEDEATTW